MQIRMTRWVLERPRHHFEGVHLCAVRKGCYWAMVCEQSVDSEAHCCASLWTQLRPYELAVGEDHVLYGRLGMSAIENFKFEVEDGHPNA